MFISSWQYWIGIGISMNTNLYIQIWWNYAPSLTLCSLKAKYPKFKSIKIQYYTILHVMSFSSTVHVMWFIITALLCTKWHLFALFFYVFLFTVKDNHAATRVTETMHSINHFFFIASQRRRKKRRMNMLFQLLSHWIPKQGRQNRYVVFVMVHFSCLFCFGLLMPRNLR